MLLDAHRRGTRSKGLDPAFHVRALHEADEAATIDDRKAVDAPVDQRAVGRSQRVARAERQLAVHHGDLPDLFREGQGIVAEGTFDERGVFVAKQVLAKHDERYMPRDVAKALKKQGEWRGEGAVPPTYGKPTT